MIAHAGQRLVIVAVAITLVLAVPPAFVARAEASRPDPVEFILFWGDGCPHCETEREFLEELRSDYPDLVISKYEVWHDAANRRLFVETAATAGVDAQAVRRRALAQRR